MTEIEIPWALQKELTMIRTDRVPNLPFLKPSIVECVKQKLGEGTTYEAEGDFEQFTLSDGRTVDTEFKHPDLIPDAFKQIPLPPDVGPHPNPSVVFSDNAPLANRLFEILQECAIGKVSLAAIRRGVAQREGSKAYKAVFKGTPLPRDLAALVGNMAATKKIDGGRRTRKQKKGKKSKKTLKRRR